MQLISRGTVAKDESVNDISGEGSREKEEDKDRTLRNDYFSVLENNSQSYIKRRRKWERIPGRQGATEDNLNTAEKVKKDSENSI